MNHHLEEAKRHLSAALKDAEHHFTGDDDETADRVVALCDAMDKVDEVLEANHGAAA